MVLPRNPDTNAIRGFAFIEYETEEAAKEAVRLKTVLLQGRAMVIKKSTRKITTTPSFSGERSAPRHNDGDGFAEPLPVK